MVHTSLKHLSKKCTFPRPAHLIQDVSLILATMRGRKIVKFNYLDEGKCSVLIVTALAT
jgi:hypothetical protein